MRDRAVLSGYIILKKGNIQLLLATSLKESCREETRLFSGTCLA